MIQYFLNQLGSARMRVLHLLVLFTLVGAQAAVAQVIERQIAYQGQLTVPSGQPVSDGAYEITLRLYDAATGGTMLFEEQQTVSVTGGLFRANIGAVNSLAGVDFDQQVWLETTLDGQAPFLPRTRALVVPYAIRAEQAETVDAVDDATTGLVRSLNDAEGNLTVVGENGITVTRDGDTIRLVSLISEGAIEEFSSDDGTIAVTNGNGPRSDLGVADGAISSRKIVEGAVVTNKLASGSLTTSKIQDEQVTAEKLSPGLIPTELPPSGPAGGDLTGFYPDPEVRQNAVLSPMIASGEVRNSDLASESVTSRPLGSGSVTSGRLAEGSVVTSKFADESVSSDKLTQTSASAGVYGNERRVPRLLVGERGRVQDITDVQTTELKYTGPAGGDLTGGYPNPTIRPLAVTNDDLADNSVNGSKIFTGTVTSADIANGTIMEEDLEPGLIPTTLPPTGPAGGILAGTYPNPSLNDAQGTQVLNALNSSAVGTVKDELRNPSGVTPGTYGDGTNGVVPRMEVDAKGRVLSVNEQAILKAVPTGNAGGDLTGTYPDPTLRTTSNAGSRMVDAIRADAVGGDADISTANNIIVLNSTTQLPAVSGAQLSTLDAGSFTKGLLPIVHGGTNSAAPLQNNRIMISSGGKIVESEVLDAQEFLISSGSTTPPVAGTIQAGAGMTVSFSGGAFVLSAETAPVITGTQADQTMRWNGSSQAWEPTSDLRVTAAGDSYINNDLAVAGNLTSVGNSTVGTANNTVNRIGVGPTASNSIGSSSATNWVRGTTWINTTGSAPTRIGSPNGASSTTISVGSSSFLTLNGIDAGNPYAFLLLDPSNNVRRTSAEDFADEGLQFQNNAIRLGATSVTVNPFLEDRWVNMETHTLSFNRHNTADAMMYLQAQTDEVYVSGPTNINTASADTTAIGNPASRTIIGGQLDPRGNITNEQGFVRIIDETQVIGVTQINTASNYNIYLGNQAGTGDQSIAMSVGQGANGYMVLKNIKTDLLPLYAVSLDVNDRVRKTPLGDMAREGIIYTDGSLRLGTKGTHVNPYLSDRYISLDEYSLTFNRAGGTDNMLWIDADTDQWIATTTTKINTTGSHPTLIGNPGSQTFVNGTLTVVGATELLNTLTVFGATTLQSTLNVVGATSMASTLLVQNATTLQSTLDVGGATSLLNTLDVTGATTLLSTLDVAGETTVNNTLLATSDQAGYVATIVNTENGNGDGLLIKLGRTHGAWNGGSYLNITNPATVFFGGALTTVKGWLNGGTFSATDILALLPASALAGALAELTNFMIGEINDGLNLPLTIVKKTEIIKKIKLWDSFDIGICPVCVTIPGASFGPYSIGPWEIPAIPTIPTGGLPTLEIPNLSGTNVANSLTRENHFVTFADKDDRQAGAIMAESVNDWRDNTVLDDVYVTQIAGAFVGIDLLGAAMLGFSEIVNLIDAYNNIGVAYESGAGDYAEWLERADHSESIAPGDIVGVVGGKISKDLNNAEQIMVVSHHPIVRGNAPYETDRANGNDVAFIGQVPAKVIGPVATGDFIVATGAIKGYAKAVAPESMKIDEYERVVGRSWESHPATGPKYVNIVIGVDTAPWAAETKKLEQRQDRTENRIDRLENTLEDLLGVEFSDENSKVNP